MTEQEHAPSDEELENMIEGARAMRATVEEILASKRHDILILENMGESYELAEQRLLEEAARRKAVRTAR